MRIALAQINPTVGDLKGNLSKIIDYIRRSKKDGAELVVFPEMALTGYPPEDLLYKKHFINDNLKALRGLIQSTSSIAVIVGFVDRDAKGNLYNAAAIIENKKLKGVYHKQHLPNYGVFDEKRYFQSGAKKSVFNICGTKLGVNICEDIWIDQPLSKQAKMWINISSSPYDVGKLKARHKLLKERAKKNKTTIIYVNLIGGQDELVFDGGSLVVDPSGEIVACARAFEEDLLAVDLTAKRSKGKKAKSLTMIERVYKALVLGARDYIIKNGFHKVVIGLSGGIDSALVAAIAVDAIGVQNVIGVTMPSQYSSSATNSDAKRLAKNLGIECKEIPIKNIHGIYIKTLSGPFSGLKTGITEENIQARIRGNILMALSNKFGWLVLTTGNKSEIAVGYCTLYGDMSGGFAVIKDVPKMMVYELAKFINRTQGTKIPTTTIKRAPSAELRLNQKDQDSLPPYPALDAILKEYVEEHRSKEALIKKYNERFVEKATRLVDLSEYKRRQAPPGIKITTRAFGRDWRLPITNKYKK